MNTSLNFDRQILNLCKLANMLKKNIKIKNLLLLDYILLELNFDNFKGYNKNQNNYILNLNLF